ncbi:MarR family transcriptional regulator [uncultured Solobacterium sp.]|uniref:MarR family winged helix-turn-helix transcriptional regulator n=1 Tax=uncultured Solobacterium sp. TaxID=747375 RepID=UPI0028F05CE7|nr:MarR family transcriptional regulator [uncultured Solobacterium sp.]
MTRKIDCGEYIHWISDVLEKRTELLLAKGGLTLSQLMVIESFHHSKDGYQTVQDIQNALHVAQPTASGLVKRMEKKGLLKRIDSKDKREKVITLTDEGYAAITNARKGMISTESILLSSLSEEEGKQFHSLLDKVWNSLDKDLSRKK